jgi:membrane protein DedA with SNARE-associated domain
MLKSFTPVIIMLTAYLASVETPTMPVIYSVIVISIGTAATCSVSYYFTIYSEFQVVVSV